jgi:DNA-directed RNA polymerase specialized sigma subunit
MITAEYIRGILETINERIYNIERERQMMMDTKDEIIEMLSLKSPTFGDKIQAQSSEKVTDLISWIPIEMSRQRREMSYTAAWLEARESEIGALKYCIKRLDDRKRCVIYKRYFDRMDVDAIAVEMKVHRNTITKRTDEAIREITARFNKNKAQPIKEATWDTSSTTALS